MTREERGLRYGRSPARGASLAAAVLFALAACSGNDDAETGAAGEGEREGERGAEGEGEREGERGAEGEGEREGEHEGEHGAEGQPPPDLEAGEVGHYGDDFAMPEADPLPLAEALDTCPGTGELCRVRGTVEYACENSGCWMTLEAPDEIDEVVRVRMRDYAFFIPAGNLGAAAIVEGEIELTETPEDRAEHYAEHEAEQSGQEPRDIDGPEPTYKITARAIELRAPEG